MKLHSLEVSNFRSFYGSQIIHFAKDEHENTTFIWADNAVGKTNLLNAITWCLYEEFTPNFKRKDDLLNHQAATEKQSSYSVTVVFEENSNIYRATRVGGPNEGFRLYQQSEHGDYSQLSNPNSVINSILPKDMMKYFFIDGEGAPVAVSASGEISAEDSIKDILGFKVAERALEDLNGIKREHTRKLRELNVSAELKMDIRRLEEITTEEERLKKNTDSFRKALKIIQSDINNIDEFLRTSNHASVSNLDSQRRGLERDIEAHENQIKSINREKRELVKHYAWSAFAVGLSPKAIDFIDDSQYKGTIPAPYNESLINDIIEQAECICGSEVTPGSNALNNIQKLLKKAGNPVIYGRVQRARSHLQAALDRSKRAPQEIQSVMSRVAREEHELNIKKQAVDEISQKLSDINIDQVKTAERDRQRLLNDRDTTNNRLGAAERRIEDISKDKITLNNKIKRLSASVPQAKDLEKRIKFIDQVILAINKSLENTLTSIKPLLAGEMSKFISASLPNDINVGVTDDFKVGLYSNIEGNKRLVAPSGGLTAILTLIYTSTLVQIAKIRSGAQGNILTPGAIAPLVLDAPFSHISETYTPKLSEALAEKSEQLIIFLFDKSAKGGEKIIRDKGKCGKEYYLLQETSEAQGNREIKTIKIRDKEFPIISFDSEKSTVRIKEAY